MTNAPHASSIAHWMLLEFDFLALDLYNTCVVGEFDTVCFINLKVVDQPQNESQLSIIQRKYRILAEFVKDLLWIVVVKIIIKILLTLCY